MSIGMDPSRGDVGKLTTTGVRKLTRCDTLRSVLPFGRREWRQTSSTGQKATTGGLRHRRGTYDTGSSFTWQGCPRPLPQ
jgi:hypothetical protein